MLTNQPTTNNANKKPSRQQIRQQQREMLKQQKQMKKYMNSPVPRAEITQYLNSVQQRLSQMDLILASLQHIILEKGIITAEDFGKAIKFQKDKGEKFREVVSKTGNYEERIEICKEYEIPIEATNIPAQLKEDKELTLDEKLVLADKHGIALGLVNEEGFVSKEVDKKEENSTVEENNR